MQENLETFLARAAENGRGDGVPWFIEREFREFLKCGVLAHGFLRLRCQGCRHERLLAFSCKRRGFCPSCGGRRMAETAAFLADELVPRAPVRQWVLSFPIPVRYILAANPQLMARVLEIVIRAIGGGVRQRARERAVRAGESLPPAARNGVVTLVQRFGGSVNLNIHFHMLFLDGAYAVDESGGARFYRADAPSTADVAAMVERVAERVTACLERAGYVDRATGRFEAGEDRLQADEPLLSDLVSASVQYRIAMGERAGCKVRRLKAGAGSGETDREDRSLVGARCASHRGFSLHANTSCEADEREKLERLCRYVARPPIAAERLSVVAGADRVTYRLKTPYRDGTTHVVFTPLELMEKLAALVPRPRVHLIRYHGVFGPNAKLRPRVVAQAPVPVQPDGGEEVSRSHRMSWAKLLKRVFDIDMTVCPACGHGPFKPVAAIMKRELVKRILDHLRLPSEIPKPWPARAPPQGRFEQNSAAQDEWAV